jgi:hypothetical protein
LEFGIVPLIIAEDHGPQALFLVVANFSRSSSVGRGEH